MYSKANQILIALVITGITVVGGCSPFDGKLPDKDRLYYPGDLALHPDGDVLYVMNTNFDSEYRVDLGGTISVIDLDTLTLEAEHTLCIPSFGGELIFSGTTADNGSPRYLFASTRENNGVISLNINPDNHKILTCPAKTTEIADTCVADIEDLPNVDNNRRELPCAAYNIVDDPYALQLVPNDGPLMSSLDSVAVAGISSSNMRVINFIDGEIRGENGTGNLDREAHVTPEIALPRGPSALAFHPITHTLYVASRFSKTFALSRFLFRTEDVESTGAKAGYVATSAVVGTAPFSNANSNAEIRDIAFSDDGTRLYATEQNPGSIVIMDTSLSEDNEPFHVVVDRIPLPGDPSSLVLEERGGRRLLYVSLFDDRAIAIVDVQKREVIRRIHVGEAPYDLELDPERRRLYVALFTDHSVGIIDIDPASSNYGQLISTIR